MNTILAQLSFLPFMPTEMATSVEGQVQWWFLGFISMMSFLIAGTVVRAIRASRTGNFAP